MKKTQKIISIIFLMMIFINHLFLFFHVFEHKDSTYTTSDVLKFHQATDVTNSCAYCDFYLNLDPAQQETTIYSLIVPENVSKVTFEREKKLLSFLVLRKKSRSPPSYNS